MQLNKLIKSTEKKKKRVGRGYGSGKGGHTATRGSKGQLSRSSVPIWFEGGQLPLIRRLPFQRGKGRFKSLAKETLGINLAQLEKSLQPNDTVDLKTLQQAGIISTKDINTRRIKILGHGELTKPLTITLPISQSAQAKVEKAGGKVDREQDN